MSQQKYTLFDVAKRAGVSHMTVSRYFNKPEMLAPATYKQVKEALDALQYVPNAAARNLASGRTTMISLLVTDITNPFFTTIARGAEDEARSAGYTFILGNTDETIQQERAYLDMLIAHRVEGIILTPTRGSRHHLPLLHHHGIPVVLIDRYVPGVRVDLVRGDSLDGGRQLTDHLIKQGYRDIAFVGGDPDTTSLRDRLAGYEQAMFEAGLKQRTYLGRYDQSSGQEIVDDLISTSMLPEAMVAANNVVAVGALMALRNKGVRIPQDVAVTCIDDIPAASAIDPFLTVAAQPAYDIGRVAMKTLIDRIKGDRSPPREHVLPVRLIVRRSSVR